MNAPPAAPSTPVPQWQTVLAGLSLAMLSVVVLSPIATTVLSFWALVLGVASAWTLEVIGARPDPVLRESVEVAIALLGMTGLVALTGAAVAGVKKLGSRNGSNRAAPAPSIYYSPPIPTTPKRPSAAQQLVRHPWLSFGGLVLFVDGCVVPAHASRAVRFPPAILGGFVLAGAALLFLFAAALTARAWWYGMRTLWGGVRRSAFFAGMVTAGSTLATVVTLVLGMAVAQAASALSAQETARALETCSGSAGDCTQKLLQSAVGPKPRQLAPAPGGNGLAPPPEPPPGFDECVEELHRPDAAGKITRNEAVALAYSYTRDFASAEDIVEDAIIDVCFQGDRIVNVRPYFIQSVKNAAARETRQSRRFCPLEPNDPPPFPEPCFQEGPILDLIRLERRMKAIEEALCELDGDQRKVVVLRLQGLSHAEIARRLRISEATARQRHSRAVQALRSKFDQRCQ